MEGKWHAAFYNVDDRTAFAKVAELLWAYYPETSQLVDSMLYRRLQARRP